MQTTITIYKRELNGLVPIISILAECTESQALAKRNLLQQTLAEGFVAHLQYPMENWKWYDSRTEEKL